MQLVLIIFVWAVIKCATPTEDLSIPDLKVDHDSLDAVNLANEISQHFKRLKNPHEQGASMNLNLKVMVKVRHGVPDLIRLPEGQLAVLYFARDRRTNKVNLDYMAVRMFMQNTVGSTKMTRLPNGKGVLFTGWAKSRPELNRNSKVENIQGTQNKTSRLEQSKTHLPNEGIRYLSDCYLC